ncbi:MAG: histidine kinase dimerization/phospho-acceptor domain-containing protein [Hymenobacter sp.]
MRSCKEARAGGPRLLPARRVGLQKPRPGEVGISGHDFARIKTPLASINLSLMLMCRTRALTRGRRQEIAGGIRAETQRLLGMVGQLIEVARLDAGKEVRLNLGSGARCPT